MTQPEGFAISVELAAKAATESLPRLSLHVGGQAVALQAQEGLRCRGGDVPALLALQATCTGYADLLVQRLGNVSDAIGETAEALSDIVRLYRRVDGQS